MIKVHLGIQGVFTNAINMYGGWGTTLLGVLGVKYSSWTTAFRRPWCFVGVGWGGACINVHVNLHMNEVDATLWLSVRGCIHGWGLGWGGVGTSCYATVRSLGLLHIRHAALLDVLLDFHAYVMLRYWTLSWTSTHTSCYAATLLYVLLDFHAYVMLRHWTLSWTSTRTSCYATVRSLGLPRIGHATLL